MTIKNSYAPYKDYYGLVKFNSLIDRLLYNKKYGKGKKMTPELDVKLVKDFPNLYHMRYGDMKETCMCWGFECGDGWYELIYDLSKNLEALILNLPEKERSYTCASQVKEKYGSLRFYMRSSTDEMDKLINEAESKSGKICETCGEKGKIRGKYWLYCACVNHIREEVFSAAP